MRYRIVTEETIAPAGAPVASMWLETTPAPATPSSGIGMFASLRKWSVPAAKSARASSASADVDGPAARRGGRLRDLFLPIFYLTFPLPRGQTPAAAQLPTASMTAHGAAMK